ncbi:hypothetical protein CIHG_07315 [Coccidioides immitis H538.4]|uniref:Uncharacterized protein n=1 Tax=Coccidioides immitis H538.4 TaxID=396776 RepID=A0A0J8UPQ7_COCIT|nr:hypothetical protein CIHG_07315 [Coccidioides immitis H538.4]
MEIQFGIFFGWRDWQIGTPPRSSVALLPAWRSISQERECSSLGVEHPYKSNFIFSAAMEAGRKAFETSLFGVQETFSPFRRTEPGPSQAALALRALDKFGTE